jgi:hypothetical protein
VAKAAAKGIRLGTPQGRIRFINEMLDPAEHNILEILLMEAAKNGANPADIDFVRSSVHFMNGTAQDANTSAFRSASTFLYLWGTLALMGRAGWTSIAEPAIAVARMKDGRAALTALVSYVSQLPGLNRTQNAAELRALAEVIGVVTNGYNEQALQTLQDLNAPDAPSVQRTLATFFHLNLLTPLTNAQRRATIPGWHVWMRNRLATATTETGAKRDIALADLREMGIPADRVDAMHAWMQSLNGRMPDGLAVLDSDGGRMWASAINEGVFTTIQEPDKGTKPRFASSPWGRLTFGLMSFAYTFQRNVMLRYANNVMRDAEIRQANGATPAAAWAKTMTYSAGWAVAGFASLFAGQLVITAIREKLFNGEEWERRRLEGSLEDWLFRLALSRTGVYGAFDPVVQSFTGLKYQRDLTAIMAGPFAGTILQAAQSVGGLGFNNTPNTNNAEYAAVKDSYRAIVAPGLAFLLTAMPGSPFFKTPALQVLTSNRAADAAAEALVGEKDSTIKRREKERRDRMTPEEKRAERQRKERERRERRQRERLENLAN